MSDKQKSFTIHGIQGSCLAERSYGCLAVWDIKLYYVDDVGAAMDWLSEKVGTEACYATALICDCENTFLLEAIQAELQSDGSILDM